MCMKNLISIKNYKFFQYIFTQRGEHYEEPEQFSTRFNLQKEKRSFHF